LIWLVFNATFNNISVKSMWDSRGRDRMVVGFTTTVVISAFHHWCCNLILINTHPIQYTIRTHKHMKYCTYTISIYIDLSLIWLVFNATFNNISVKSMWDSRGRDRMVVGFTTTVVISAFHHWCCEFESRSGRGVQH
jgi:hypothetical protein